VSNSTKLTRKVRTAAANGNSKSSGPRSKLANKSIAKVVDAIVDIMNDESDSDVRAALELCGMAGYTALRLDREEDHTGKHCRDLIDLVSSSLAMFHDLPKLRSEKSAYVDQCLYESAVPFHQCETAEDRRHCVQAVIADIRWWTRQEPKESAASAVHDALEVMLRKGGQPRREHTDDAGKAASNSILKKDDAKANVLVAFGLLPPSKNATETASRTIRRGKRPRT
jgi:hypothetical protein